MASGRGDRRACGGGARAVGRSERKHRAILAAAEADVPAGGYLGTNMDELAARSQVSKQTIYAHFGSKEALFVELVHSMTDAAGERVHHDVPDPPTPTTCPTISSATPSGSSRRS